MPIPSETIDVFIQFEVILKDVIFAHAQNSNVGLTANLHRSLPSFFFFLLLVC